MLRRFCILRAAERQRYVGATDLSDGNPGKSFGSGTPMSGLGGPSHYRSCCLNGEVVGIRPLPLSRLSAEEAITNDGRIPYVDPEIPENCTDRRDG